MIYPYSKMHTVSTVFLHKYGGANVSVTNFMSHFSMTIPTKADVGFSSGNMGHAQLIGIILYSFNN